MSCQQTFVNPVEVVGLSKLHILHQSCGRRSNRSSNDVASLKVFVLQRRDDISSNLPNKKIKNDIVKMVVFICRE